MEAAACWCASSNLISFNEDYFRCQSCDTIVGRIQPENPAAFYGPDYWTTRQTEHLGHPDIHQRARDDLSSRAVYWLKTLLNYKQPPGTTLEIGSGHGGFSALLQWAGFHATGLEPNPWVSQLAQTAFNIPTLTGSLAEQSLNPATFDVIILLDVLEHLPNPLETLRHCRKLLNSNGILLIQTPCAPPNTAVEKLEQTHSPFPQMLLPLEHLYLYTERGIEQLLTQTGFPHLTFEKALFPYDMFLVGSTAPALAKTDPAKTLLETPNGRFVLALLDLHQKWQKANTNQHNQLEQINHLTSRLQEAETDRAARVVQAQALTERLKESEADRQARLAQTQELTALLQSSEADRAARLKQVQKLTAHLQASEADHQARLEQVQTLTGQLKETEEQTAAHLFQIGQLTNWLKESEQDRANRLAQVEQLTDLLETAEADRTARLAQVTELTTLLAESETDRAARFEQIQTLTAVIQNQADGSA
jgi:SAM-dependent methyltransferase